MRKIRVIAFAFIALLIAPFGQFSAAADPIDEVSGLDIDLTSSDETLIFTNSELEEQLRFTPLGVDGAWSSNGNEKLVAGVKFSW
jgi:hypothetical protein